MNFFKSILYIFLLTASIMACNLEKQIDLDIPEAPKELVIECYLEPGKPLLALVLETQDFFDTLGTDLPIVTDATVVISHNGQLDTLALGFYTDGEKVYNYGKPTVIVPQDFTTEYTLTVTDANSISKCIVETADNVGADLIVAGAWGHRRLREIIFGGVTKSLLSNQKHSIYLSH